MPVYTIIVSFADHTSGIDQCEAQTPHQGLATFLRTAESLEEYDKRAVDQLIGGGDKIDLVHVANGLRGFWIWVPALVDDSRIENILGGYVIQTDPNGPRRA